MIVTIPARLQSFCERFHDDLTPGRCRALEWLLAGFLLGGGKRSQSALGRTVLGRVRAASSVSRRLRRPSFRTRDLVRAEMQRQVQAELTRAAGHEETWFLAIDGVCLKRGSRTKVENAIQYRTKRRGRRGRSTKAHAFVLGVLLTPTGRRIPLPRRSYYTRSYLRRQNDRLRTGRRRGQPLAYKSQVDLACLVVKELDLPTTIRLVVVADEYFEGTKLTSLCRKKGYPFIAPVNSLRKFATGGRVQARGKALPRTAYRTLILRRGEEETASHRRRRPSGAGEKGERRYRLMSERRTLSRTGEVAVVYSWKQRRNRSGRWTAKETFKTLVCSDPTLPGEAMVEYYEVRWEIEVVFRELKSDLGLGDYQGTDFAACERHVDLVLLSFMALEVMRSALMAETPSPVRRRERATLRTRALTHRLHQEAFTHDLAWLKTQAASSAFRGHSIPLQTPSAQPA